MGYTVILYVYEEIKIIVIYHYPRLKHLYTQYSYQCGLYEAHTPS